MAYLDPEFSSLPDGWNSKELQEVVKIHNTKRQPLNGREREGHKGSYPYCGANGVVDYIDDYRFDGEYVLIAEDGGYWGKHQPSSYIMRGKFWVNNHAHVVSAIPTETTNTFFSNIVNYLNIDPFIGGDARGKLTKAILTQLAIPLPPLPEQKKIAHILSTVQRAIEAQERIIQTTTELKKALMHKLFTEGLRHEPQKQTEIGPVPKSWEVVALGEFYQIKHGFAFDGKFFKPSGEYILMTPGHFHEEGGFRDQGEKTKYFTGAIPQDYVLAKDDLVVAMTEQTSGLLGSAAFVPEDDRYLHNQRLGLIVDLDTKCLSKDFLFNVFNHPHLRVEVAKTSTGSKVKHTSPTKLRAVKVGIPPTLEEQEEIATALSTTGQKIGVAKNKKAQLQDLFRTLLHELMTAKTRVHELAFQTSPSTK